jgi:hypothetical protein
VTRRALAAFALAAGLAALQCSLLASPGDYVSGGPREAGAPASDAAPVVEEGSSDSPVGPTKRLFVIAGERPRLGSWDDFPQVSEAYSATIDASGKVGPWRVEKSPPFRGYFIVPAVAAGHLFVFGFGNDIFGGQGFGAEWIPFGDGPTGEWAGVAVANDPIQGAAMVITPGAFVLVGGSRYFNDDAGSRTVYYNEVWGAPFDSQARTVGPLTRLTGVVTVRNRSRVGAIYHKGFIYAAGGQESGGITAEVQMAAVGPNGLPASFTATTPLENALGQPYRILEPNLVVHGDTLYLVGGRLDSAGVPSDVVLGSKIAAGGTLGEWQALAKLPTPLKATGLVVAGDVMYTIGGEGVTGHTDLVHSAKIRADGTLDPWEAQGNARLPQPRSDFAAVAY